MGVPFISVAESHSCLHPRLGLFRAVYLAKNISVHSVITRAFVQNLVKFGQKGVILAKNRHFCLFFRRALRALRAPIYVPALQV